MVSTSVSWTVDLGSIPDFLKTYFLFYYKKHYRRPTYKSDGYFILNLLLTAMCVQAADASGPWVVH